MKSLSSLLLLVGATFAQTPMNLIGWGRENTSVDGPSRGMGEAGAALRTDRAWDPLLTARSSFNTLTALEVQIVPQFVFTEDNVTSNTLGAIDVPRLSIGIPLGGYGPSLRRLLAAFHAHLRIEGRERHGLHAHRRRRRLRGRRELRVRASVRSDPGAGFRPGLSQGSRTRPRVLHPVVAEFGRIPFDQALRHGGDAPQRILLDPVHLLDAW